MRNWLPLVWQYAFCRYARGESIQRAKSQASLRPDLNSSRRRWELAVRRIRHRLVQRYGGCDHSPEGIVLSIKTQNKEGIKRTYLWQMKQNLLPVEQDVDLFQREILGLERETMTI